jgi:hypothetical protein
MHEFIVFGCSPDLARPVLSDLAQRVLDGERLAVNAGLRDALPGMPAVLLDVPVVEAHHDLSAAGEFAPKTLRALQTAWSDGDDLFPWQDGYDETFRARRLILNPLADAVGRRCAKYASSPSRR